MFSVPTSVPPAVDGTLAVGLGGSLPLFTAMLGLVLPRADCGPTCVPVGLVRVTGLLPVMLEAAFC
jgi:hypothetical protein